MRELALFSSQFCELLKGDRNIYSPFYNTAKQSSQQTQTEHNNELVITLLLVHDAQYFVCDCVQNTWLFTFSVGDVTLSFAAERPGMQPSLLLLLLGAQVILYLSTIDKSLKGLSWKNICKKIGQSQRNFEQNTKGGYDTWKWFILYESPNPDCLFW